MAARTLLSDSLAAKCSSCGTGGAGSSSSCRSIVGGGAAEVVDVVDRVAADFPRTAAFILLATYLVLFLLLQRYFVRALTEGAVKH